MLITPLPPTLKPLSLKEEMLLIQKLNPDSVGALGNPHECREHMKRKLCHRQREFFKRTGARTEPRPLLVFLLHNRNCFSRRSIVDRPCGKRTSRILARKTGMIQDPSRVWRVYGCLAVGESRR